MLIISTVLLILNVIFLLRELLETDTNLISIVIYAFGTYASSYAFMHFLNGV